MREIKFRFWDNKAKNMIKWSDSFSMYGMSKFIKMIPLQYTGLKDKNSKEIYEGDIVKTANGYVGKIIFQDGAFSIYLDPERSLIVPCFVVEVIGNIYEDPELLEVKKDENN